MIAALDGRGDVGAAVRRLVAVGHSSGTALAYGVVLALSTSGWSQA
jgi:hypothetical protein